MSEVLHQIDGRLDMRCPSLHTVQMQSTLNYIFKNPLFDQSQLTLAGFKLHTNTKKLL